MKWLNENVRLILIFYLALYTPFTLFYVKNKLFKSGTLLQVYTIWGICGWKFQV